MTSYYFYPYISLTGGGDGALDSLDGSLVKDGDAAFVVNNNEMICYKLDADNGNNESSPDIIKPDTNAGNKRWVRVSAAIDGKINTVTGAANEVPKFHNNGMLVTSGVAANNLQNATKIQGKNVSSSAPGDGQILRYNNTTPAWEPTEVGSWKYSGASVYNNNGWPASWTNLDLSAAVGACRALVQLEVLNGETLCVEWGARMKGSSQEIGRSDAGSRGWGLQGGSIGANRSIQVFVVTAANGVIEIFGSNNSANSSINVLAYARLPS